MVTKCVYPKLKFSEKSTFSSPVRMVGGDVDKM